jgi:hypothetical protein
MRSACCAVPIIVFASSPVSARGGDPRNAAMGEMLTLALCRARHQGNAYRAAIRAVAQERPSVVEEVKCAVLQR